MRALAFLRDNWIWLLLPSVLLGLAVAALVLTGDDSVSPFTYALQ